MDNEVKVIVASLRPPLADGMVGFFWIVPGRSGRDELLGGIARTSRGGTLRQRPHPPGRPLCFLGGNEGAGSYLAAQPESQRRFVADRI